jgi:hypothetical protein
MRDHIHIRKYLYIYAYTYTHINNIYTHIYITLSP